MIQPLKPQDFDAFFALLEQSFPPEEYRPYAAQRALLENPAYCPLILQDADGAPCGLIALWDLGTFGYVEHLAVAPSLRCGGLGRQLLTEGLSKFGKRVCLEVEPPETELARRRIGFYRRCGLTLHPDYPYLQPPLAEGRSAFPLLLMTTGGLASRAELDTMRDTLHAVVYPHFPEVQP